MLLFCTNNFLLGTKILEALLIALPNSMTLLDLNLTGQASLHQHGDQQGYEIPALWTSFVPWHSLRRHQQISDLYILFLSPDAERQNKVDFNF